MKKIGYLIGSATTFALPFVAAAQAVNPSGSLFDQSLQNILTFTTTTLIPFIIGIGFLVFVWGMFQYFIAGGANDEAKAKGKSLMIYAILGFVLIIVFWGVINLVATSTGLNSQTLNNTLVPQVTP